MKSFRSLLVISILAAAGVISIGNAVAQEIHSFKPTELQTLRLQVKQLQAQTAQKDLFIAQQNFQAALKTLNDEADKVKAENNWPKETGFDANALTFAEGPKSNPPPAPTVPKEKVQ